MGADGTLGFIIQTNRGCNKNINKGNKQRSAVLLVVGHLVVSISRIDLTRHGYLSNASESTARATAENLIRGECIVVVVWAGSEPAARMHGRKQHVCLLTCTLIPRFDLSSIQFLNTGPLGIY